MFQAFKQKTAELKDRTRQRFNTASEQGRKLRENVESLTGVDKARERYAQARIPSAGAARQHDSEAFLAQPLRLIP